MTGPDFDDLAVQVAQIDPRLAVELVDGTCVLHGPKTVSTCAEVRALRLIEKVTPRFQFRADR